MTVLLTPVTTSFLSAVWPSILCHNFTKSKRPGICDIERVFIPVVDIQYLMLLSSSGEKLGCQVIWEALDLEVLLNKGEFDNYPAFVVFCFSFSLLQLYDRATMLGLCIILL